MSLDLIIMLNVDSHDVSLCYIHFLASANRPSFAAKDSHGARGAVAPAPFDR